MLTRIGLIVSSFTLAVGLTPGAGPVACAGSIVYTESFTATGTLGAQSFTDRAVTLTALGDTAAVSRNPAIAMLNAVTSTVAVDGLTTATFTDTLTVFDVYNPRFGGIFGITDIGSGSGGDILDVRDSVFLTYDLTSSIGPVVGSFADFMSLNKVSGTSAGDLVFTSVADTVTVTAAAVPEPPSMTLLGLGLLSSLCFATRRRA
jgi:hypothetical protein